MAAKHSITPAIDRTLLTRARALAVRRALSVSALLADELRAFVTEDAAYWSAERLTTDLLKDGLPLGGAGEKRDRVVSIYGQLLSERTGYLSVRVLQELFVRVTRTLRTLVAQVRAREIVRAYSPCLLNPTTPQTVLRATELGEAADIGHWDALIVAAAEQGGATILHSEDLNDGQGIVRYLIANRFK